MMENNNNPLWEFSLHVYSDTDFSDTCLKLQDEYDLNINVLLLMIWTGMSGAKLTDDAVMKILRHSNAWQESCVQPLRNIRKGLKSDIGAVTVEMSGDFREEVKKLELDAERLEQDMLMKLLLKLPAVNARDGDRKAVARRNLLSYLMVKDIKVDASIKEAFERLLNHGEQGFLAIEYAQNENNQEELIN